MATDGSVQLSRRQVVAAFTVAGAAVPNSPALAGPQRAASDQDLSDVNRKFSADGQVLPFVGNTILCHIPQQGDQFEQFNQLLTVYRELPDYSFSRKLAALPTSSYHMTVLDGANQDNNHKPSWPTLFPRDMDIAACSRGVIEHLRNFSLDCRLPLRMVVDQGDRPSGPLTLPLRPVDEEETRKLRGLRARLARQLGILLPEPDAYGFHITIAYRFAHFDPQEERDYHQALGKWKARLAEQIDVLELGSPEVCTFKDMYAYQTHYRLAT